MAFACLFDETCLVLRKIPYVMDIHRLIAEIRNRPGLWNLHSAQYKDRNFITRLWNQVAKSVGADVEECKRKWRNLRDAYRAEIRRSERRMARDRLMGITYDENNYKSKWIYFDELEFMRGYKRRSCFDEYYGNTNSNSNDYDDEYAEPDNDNDSYDAISQNSIEIKMEHNDGQIDDDTHKMYNNLKHQEFIEDSNEMANEMIFENFENIEMNQERVKRQSEQDFLIDEHKHPSTDKNLDAKQTTNDECKCTKRSERHVHFPENVGREEQELVTSTKQEKMETHNSEQIRDSDFNFLVSFLPHMKKMSTLQNLQFRAKMSEVVLNTLAPAITGQAA